MIDKISCSPFALTLIARLAIILTVLGGGSSCSKEPPASIVVESAYMEVLSPNQESAPVLMSVTNNSKISQSLNYVHTPAAGYVDIYRGIYVDGARKGRKVQRMTMQPGESKVLSTQGYHLMLQGIYDNLEVGDTFDITLEYESGEVVITQVEVRARR